MIVRKTPAKRRYYRKLVRDGIIERMQAKGLRPKWRTLSPVEMAEEALRKLIEEATEALDAYTDTPRDTGALLEELADIDTIYAVLLKALSLTRREVRLAERLKRGRTHVRGFNGRAFLISADAE